MLKKASLFVFKLIATLIVLIIIAAVIIAYQFNPNEFKQEISHTFLKHTGLQLKLNGKINLSYYPWLKIKTHNIEVASKKNQTIKIGDAAFGIKLLPLLTGKLVANNLALSKVDLVYYNQSNQAVFSINNANINTGPVVLNQPFDLKVNGKFIIDNGKQSGSYKITSQIIIKDNLAAIQLKDLQGIAKLNKQAFTFNGAAEFKPDTQTLYLQQFNLLGKNLLLNQADGYLTLNPTKQLIFKGDIKAQECNYNLIKAKTINVNLLGYKNKTTIVYDIKNINQGIAKGSLDILSNQKTPDYNLKSTIKNMQAQRFLKQLFPTLSNPITGKLNLNLAVKTRGAVRQQLIKNLNGKAHFGFHNGVLHGVNLNAVINTGANLLSGQVKLPVEKSNQTQFGHLTGDFNIKNGIAQTNNLILQSQWLKVTGGGRINCVAQSLDLLLQATQMHAKVRQGQRVLTTGKLTVPLKVSGSFSKPNVQLDTDQVLKSQAQRQIKLLKKKVGKKIGKDLNKLLNGLF